MRRSQWLVFGFGLMIFSAYMFFGASTSICNPIILTDEQMTACFVRRYAFSIPALISQFLGWIFMICGFLEPKKQH